MFCPKCGKINPDNEEFCSGCNAPLHESEQEKPACKKGKTIKIILAAVLVVVVAVVMVVSFGGCAKRPIAPDAKMEISF